MYILLKLADAVYMISEYKTAHKPAGNNVNF